MYIKISGLGAAVPANKIMNSDLPKALDTSDEWIKSRTGIKSRYHASGTQTTSSLACEAGKAAMISGDFKNNSSCPFDALIIATTTPDRSCPATAPKVAHALGFGKVSAFDINAVCSGFVYGLQLSEALIKSGKSKKLMLMGVDTFSSILNPADRTTFPLFGDAAAAFILEASETENNIIDTLTMSDGEHEDLITVKNGFFKMAGADVFSRAVAGMSSSVQEILSKNNMNIRDIDFLVPHQANLRIMDTLAHLFELDRNKVLISLDEYGNTSAASIPLTLVKACSEKRIKANDKIVVTAFGGGLTWGAGLMIWPETPFNPRISLVQ